MTMEAGKAISGSAADHPDDKKLNDDSGVSLPSKSQDLARAGVYTTQDTIFFLSALLSDLNTDKVGTNRSNASCNIIRNMMRAAELEARYGQEVDNNRRVLSFVHRAPPQIPSASLRAMALAKLTTSERMALGFEPG